jgi:LacI family transcriptional regulator
MIRKLRRTTIRDVADRAKVSVTAVSRYLNGQLVLPAETAERIESAVRELAYVPNAIARRLSRRRSETIGLITSDIVYSFFAAIASAAEVEASDHGLSLVIFQSRNDPKKELQFLSRLDDNQVDGMLLMTNHLDDGKLRDKINSIPRVVLLDEDVPGAKVPKLFAENERGGWLATRHLLRHGHTRIAYFGGPRGMISADERYVGFCRALAEIGLRPDPTLVSFSAYETDDAERVFHRMWVDARPTAIFASGDMLTLGILRAMQDMGLSSPADLSLIGFDDMPNAELFSPPLTTIRQSAEDFGRRGVKLLLSHMDGKRVVDPPRISVELIDRNSVGAPPVAPIRRTKTVVSQTPLTTSQVRTGET